MNDDQFSIRHPAGGWHGRAAWGVVVMGLLLLWGRREVNAQGQTPVNPAQAQAQERSFPLWGDLTPGPYWVGFRSLFRFDRSRTWKETRTYAGAFSPDPNGRPIQVNVWYPAGASASGRLMTFRSYTEQTAPKEFAALNSIMEGRNRQNAESSVAPTQLPALLSTPVNAYTEAPEAVGSFPTVLYFSGLNGEINSNFVLAEFLASHGYVFASLSLLGPSEQQPAQTKSPADLEAVVRDMEFALGLLNETTRADRTRVAAMGHSVGGIEAALFGLRNGNVLATIGLDGTYGFKGSAGSLTNTYGYAPHKMRAAFLDLRRSQGEQEADLELSPVLSYRCADRSLISLTKMHHSDFTSFAMVASRFQVPIRPLYVKTGWDRETGRRGYEATCRIVLEFLDAKVNGNVQEAEKMRTETKALSGSSFRHLEAEPAPPSPRETLALAKGRSPEELQAFLSKSCGNQPASACFDLERFNAYGYELLGQNRAKDAVIVLETGAWAHPTSANAQDSLADAYLATGDKEKARTVLRRAIQLVPTDTSIPGESKDSFVAEERRRLEELK